jgi:hypothetical protein
MGSRQGLQQQRVVIVPARLFSEQADERTRRFVRRVVDAGRL